MIGNKMIFFKGGVRGFGLPIKSSPVRVWDEARPGHGHLQERYANQEDDNKAKLTVPSVSSTLYVHLCRTRKE